MIDFYNEEVDKLNNISYLLKVPNNEAEDKVNSLLKEIKDLKSEIDSLKKQVSLSEVSDIDTQVINGLNVAINSFDNKNMNELKDLVDSIKDKITDYVVVCFSKNSDNVAIVVSLSDAAVKKGLHAGNILKKLANVLGGNGGGKDKFAQGQGKDASKVDEAINLAKELINA